MNTLKFYPLKLRNNYERNIKNSGIKTSSEKFHNRIVIGAFFITIAFSTLFYFIKVSILYSIALFVVINIYFYMKTSIAASARIKKMEKVFPDVISLMSSNLRSGITADRAFLLSARQEFAPLDEEIIKTGKEIATGKDIVYALKKMSERIDSEKISKIIFLIISGLKAGGNISDLLDQTSRNMKEKEIIEKKAASNILMYVIFIFFAVAVGAPVLFGLSSVLVDIILKLTSRIPTGSNVQMDLPISFNQLAISPDFVVYFSIVFMIITDFISSIVIGYVNKGDGKSGLKFFIPLVAISLSIFFVIRIVLSNILLGIVSAG